MGAFTQAGLVVLDLEEIVAAFADHVVIGPEAKLAGLAEASAPAPERVAIVRALAGASDTCIRPEVVEALMPASLIVPG